jgi:hypothetical protein
MYAGKFNCSLLIPDSLLHSYFFHLIHYLYTMNQGEDWNKFSIVYFRKKLVKNTTYQEPFGQEILYLPLH